MTAELNKPWLAALEDEGKSGVRTQIGALCYKKRDGRLRFLLITSRERGRWIIPKGWPVPNIAPQDAALQEAWEEAGVRGQVDPRPLGYFSYVKQYDDKPDLPCMTMIFAVEVDRLARSYPEKGERKRKWVSRKKAAQLVDEAELAQLFLDFDVDAVN